MTNQNNPAIQRRLFYCPGQQRFFWIDLNPRGEHYLYAGEVIMTLTQIKEELKSYPIPERRFWDGPNNEHVMLPFNKARGRAFYLGKWQPLDILRALDVKEAPLVQQLPPATARFAPGAVAVAPAAGFVAVSFGSIECAHVDTGLAARDDYETEAIHTSSPSSE